MSDDEIRAEQKTFRHELIKEESPEGLWDLEEEGRQLRENPFKTPPDNLTTKRNNR